MNISYHLLMVFMLTKDIQGDIHVTERIIQ